MSSEPAIKDQSLKPIRTVFMGTPDFAVPGFEALAADPDFSIVAVVTQPDRPAGRGRTLTPPPIKEAALKHGYPILQPLKVREIEGDIQALAPDLIVVIAYGQIIPASILDIPVHGCLNVHASLLPKYRGAACLAAAIKNGDRETGVTVMKMDPGLDTGPIIRQSVDTLAGTETLPELSRRLAELGARILPETIKGYISGDLKPRAQTGDSSYVPTLKKEDGRIDWRLSAREIERQVRAYNPWPGTFASSNGEILKIIAADSAILEENGRQPGEAFVHEGRLAVQCGQDSLLILKLQTSGKKALDSREFLNGRQIEKFDI